MENLILNKVEEEVKSIDPEAKLVLFGSRARGDAHDDSDWDFLILTSKELNPELEDEFRNRLYKLELEFEQVISSVIENVVKWEDYLNSEFYQNIKEDGIEIENLKAA
ncbi:MAG: nucleotidyltransferase domain-containing protein [Bacteroidota bacterium]